MRIDEDGHVWFEKGDRVRPKTVAKWDKEAGEQVFVPHEKPYGGIKVEDGQVIESKLEDVVTLVDPASGQIHLRSWEDAAGRGTGSPLSTFRTRWEPSDWYEIVVPKEKPKVLGQKPKESMGKQPTG